MGQHGPDATTGGLILVRPDEVGGGTHRAGLGDIERLRRRLRLGEKMYHPAVVRDGQRLVLLAGTRRFAARQRNDTEALIPVVECSTWRDFAQWMAADTLASEGQDSKPTSLLEAAALVERVQRHLKPAYRDPVVPTVCAYLGVDAKALGYVRSILRKYVDAPGVSTLVRDYARQQLADAVTGGIAANTAYERVKLFTETLSRPTMPAAEQRHRLQTAVGTLNGVCAGLEDMGEISPDLTDGEVCAYIESLSASRLQLERTIKSLRAAKGERV